MNKMIPLKPGDVAIAVQLALRPSEQIARLAAATGRSIGEVHNAIVRLRNSRLVDDATRTVNVEPLIRFVEWGVPFAFPAAVGGPATGIPTAWMTERVVPVEPDDVAQGDVSSDFVWPAAGAQARGSALQPLYPITVDVVRNNYRLWAALALVDIVRVGGAREADVAIARLRTMLELSASTVTR